MEVDLNSIQDPRVRAFYTMYWPQHRIVRDFFIHLPEEKFCYRMVETPVRKADTPQESLAHLLQVQLITFNGVKTGQLQFKSMGVEHYWRITPAELLAEMERIDQEMFTYLTADTFDSGAMIQAPWGIVNVIDSLSFLRDHDILHIGWNLALMDHLNLPRYQSLIDYWGEGDENSF